MEIQWPDHGGQPTEMKRKFHIEKDVIDFSANIHPFGPPSWLKEALKNSYDQISHYPDPSYAKANRSLAAFDQVHDEEVLVTNGGAEAIFLTAKLFEGKHALIIQPTFSEYERACKHYHLEVEDVFLHMNDECRLPLEQIIEQLDWADVVFLCRPNNPTGTVAQESDIRRILEKAKKTGTFLVVDEAFVDFLGDGANLVHLLKDYENLILLRSLTKMYAIPGVRVGYLLANREIIKLLKQWQIPWSVNAFAEAIIPAIVNNQSFVSVSQQFFREELARIREQLVKLNFYMSPSAVNFYLLRDNEKPDSTGELFHFLFHHGVLPRHTDNFKQLNGNYLRFAVRSQQDNDLLLKALADWRDRG
ncbi:threonine-phosphate decarboxylase CobD [Salipaludibacillus daqingensis]|uniref:threonine-phosphate decarboxylase CobD n=1 Tax=Salipaludibacillus daqingensis TaxID=3041001 RepID=UPI0024752575|nr:threonine-phosphate decarboxylase CobD [Salipaludibacillus daqingensis]